MKELIDYKCPACGGAMEFDSRLQKMRCPFCDSVFEMEELAGKDDVLNDTVSADTQNLDADAGATAGGEHRDDDSASETVQDKDETWGEDDDLSVFVCNSCGGEIIGSSTTAATSCPFCGNPVVISGRFKGGLKPDLIIPFKLDEKAAKAKYLEHTKGKYLLPKFFVSQNHIDEIKGVYIPFWLYDSDVEAYARFDAEKVRVWADSKYNYTETSVFDVFRQGTMSFKNIPVDGLGAVSNDITESIEPFDFSEAVPFQSAFLAGYFADRFDDDVDKCNQRAIDRLRKTTLEVLRSTVGGNYSAVHFYEDQMTAAASRNPALNASDYVAPMQFDQGKNSNIKILNSDHKYALLPVWLLSTTYNGEKYTFAMNGQTGRMVGDLPMDRRKKNLTFAGVLAAGTVIGTILTYLLLG